jgi:hypothetical protein
MAGGGGVEARGGGCVHQAEVKMGMNVKRREREWVVTSPLANAGLSYHIM